MDETRNNLSLIFLAETYSQFFSLDEAIMTNHFRDLGVDVKESYVFRWDLERWSKLGQKITSPAFDCAGHKWYVVICEERLFKN